jgi:hypothetical protein
MRRRNHPKSLDLKKNWRRTSWEWSAFQRTKHSYRQPDVHGPEAGILADYFSNLTKYLSPPFFSLSMDLFDSTHWTSKTSRPEKADCRIGVACAMFGPSPMYIV